MSAKPRIGVPPINWWPAEVPLPESDKPSTDLVLSQMRELGFAGTELPGPYAPPRTGILPREPGPLVELLRKYDLQLAAGWFQTYFLEKPFEEELEKAKAFARTLVEMRGSVLTLGRGWNEIARYCAELGLRTGYHPHLGTVVLELDQIGRLMQEAPELTLLIDTGHLAAAGVDYLYVIDSYIDRIAHFHMKNIRPEVVARARAEPFPWSPANMAGLFTVPGYGGIDFLPIIDRLKRAAYGGWIVLEAEQDPHRFNPYAYAHTGRAYLEQVAGW